MTLDEILATNQYTQLFPTGSRKEYRTLLKLTHPDLHPNETEKANKAFIHITTIWTTKPTSTTNQPTTPKNTPSKNTIHTTRNSYIVTLKTKTKTLATYATKTSDTTREGLLLLATTPQSSTTLQKGATTLKTVKTNIPHKEYLEFFPDIKDVFTTKTKDGKKLFGIVLTPGTTNDQKWYSLKEVQNKYPQGIAGEDLAWIYRRALLTTGILHDQDVAVVTPELANYYIQPETHGFKLYNWQHTAPLNTELKTLPDQTYLKIYKNNKQTSIKNDIKAVTQMIQILLHPNTATPLKRFISGIQLAPTSTIRSALQELDEVLYQSYGPKKFHPFTIE